MKRNVAGAVVLAVGLACSACGSASTKDSARAAATITSARPTATVWLPVMQRVGKASGIGSKTVGTFAFRGELSISLSCTGKGSLDLEIVTSPPSSGLGTNCSQTGVGLGPTPAQLADLKTLPATLRSGHADRRAQIKIDAPARVHWSVTIREAYAKPSTVPAGLQQLPLRRSGVGPESLGTFAMPPGLLYIAATCVGKGTFGVWFNRPEHGISTPCLNSTHKATLKDISSPVSEHRARIDVRAPAGMKWEIVVFEGPPPSNLRDDPTNVW